MVITWQLLTPAFDGDAPRAAVSPKPPTVEIGLNERPATTPRRIPDWAWALSRWHDDKLGHQRPLDAPRVVPPWYWEWRQWRLDVTKQRPSTKPEGA